MVLNPERLGTGRQQREERETDTSSCRYCDFTMNHMLASWNSFTCDIKASSLSTARDILGKKKKKPQKSISKVFNMQQRSPVRLESLEFPLYLGWISVETFCANAVFAGLFL